MGIVYREVSQEFHLYNREISYLIVILRNGQLGQLYFGRRLRERESFGHLLELAARDMGASPYVDDSRFTLEHIRQEYPAYGRGDMRTPAFTVEGADGSRVSEFTYRSHRIYRGKPVLSGLPATYAEREEEAETLEITLSDPLLATDLILTYTVYEDRPVIARNSRFVCHNVQGVVLHDVMSLCLDLPDARWEMIELSGAWAREREVNVHALHRGIQSVGSLRGHSSHQFQPFLALKRPSADERQGEVLGFALVYSGNFLAQAEVDNFDVTRVLLGIHPRGFRWPLAEGETFQSPEALLVYSREGLNGMSRTFHRLFRTRLARGPWRDRTRPVLLNSWEAVYMDYDQETLLALAEGAAELGAELFVLDDGWFGHRDDATTSLGDWFADRRKLPDGIGALARQIQKRGLALGLWIEPEMISEDSELFRAHPDWRLAVPGRVPCQGRRQYVLDFSREEVVDAVGDMLVELLSEAPISYIKWDMNRSLTDVYSRGYPPEEQGTIFHRYVLGVYRLYERLTRGFPDVLFESCASGGARMDPGMLYYAPQCWISDNTDAVARLKIQYGTSYLYPLSCMGSHISASPNHQAHRSTSMRTRALTALFGTYGYELDPRKLTEEEKREVKEQLAFQKTHRELIAQGDFYRLVSPYEGAGNETAWMVVSEDRRQAIVAYYRVLQPVNVGFRHLQLQGLDERASYRITGILESHYGDELMEVGLVISDEASGIPSPEIPQGDYQARVWVLTAEELDGFSL